jgi:hypothetical protein
MLANPRAACNWTRRIGRLGPVRAYLFKPTHDAIVTIQQSNNLVCFIGHFCGWRGLSPMTISFRYNLLKDEQIIQFGLVFYLPLYYRVVKVRLLPSLTCS